MKHLKEIERHVSRLFSARWTDLHEDRSLARLGGFSQADGTDPGVEFGAG